MCESKDSWEENKDGLSAFLRQHPEVAMALDETDESSLNGADLACKSSLLQERGLMREAAELFQMAWRKCYPEEYIREFEGQLDFIAGELQNCSGPIVDIASGRGMLVERLLKSTTAPVTATDLSESVLLDHLGCRFPDQVRSGRLNLTPCDAKNMPFPDGSIPALTTCLGLQNIPGRERAAGELRRVCGGRLYALCMFFPDGDAENQGAVKSLGLEGAYSQGRLAALLESCGWRVSPHEGQRFRLPPTPTGVVVPGAGFDALPVVETEAWFVTFVCE